VTAAHVTVPRPTFEPPIVEVLTDPVTTATEPVVTPVGFLGEPITVPDVAVVPPVAETLTVDMPVEVVPAVEAPVITEPVAETPATEPAGSRFRRLIEERTQGADDSVTAGTLASEPEGTDTDTDIGAAPGGVIEILPATASVEVVQPEVVDARVPAVPMTRKLPQRTRALRITSTRKNGRKRWTVDFLVRAPDADDEA
jgi:hypothetical protein